MSEIPTRSVTRSVHISMIFVDFSDKIEIILRRERRVFVVFGGYSRIWMRFESARFRFYRRFFFIFSSWDVRIGREINYFICSKFFKSIFQSERLE